MLDKKLSLSLMAVTAAAALAPAADAATGFTGLYAGVSLGARVSQNDWITTAVENNPPAPFSSSGDFGKTAWKVSGSLGDDWAIGPHTIVGLEAQIGYSSSEKTRGGVPPMATATSSITVKTDVEGALRARLGYEAAPGVLVYATGGIAAQRLSVSASCVSTDPWCLVNENDGYKKTLVGWTLGVGGEKQISPHYRFRVDYRYSKYNAKDAVIFYTNNALGSNDNIYHHIESNVSDITVGLMRKF